MSKPYVLLSAAVSLDGYLDDTGPERLLLSSPADFDRVDEVRASVDAILVGAGTIRADNPRLLVNSPERRAARVAAGLPEYPLKVTVSGSGELDPAAQFWHTGGDKVLYTTEKGAERARAAGLAADVVALGGFESGGFELGGPKAGGPESGGSGLDWRALLADLHARGVRRLMVEGGGHIHTQLLQQELADELQLVLAPLFVGDPAAPRLFGPGGYQPGRLRLVETRRIQDVVLMRYEPTAPGAGGSVSAADHHWLRLACELAERCPPSETAFSVGAVVVAADGTELARGHSREGGDPVVHAEEAALAKIDAGDARLASATVYSSLEPCARRASRPAACARLILDAGVRRVVTGWREPDTFVAGADGSGLLAAGGVDVVVLPEYEALAKAPNRHLAG
ncbi:dihydrofolate reductase family protein [Streptomyces sp. TRM68416]|uniref:dihydrofolate reductase family protein n=1 Tax=Streptomyces sp. TRM68416 TaxID=2758412 RepID=UPI001661BDB7|nr:dihydrofolate reductase family protein [Streptomyces sp. TRM68416]MBD0842355.1 dihydrofolate reductase family protein [Streptomyces sp. TRM68416]